MSESQKQFQQISDSEYDKELVDTLKSNHIFTMLMFSNNLIKQISRHVKIISIEDNKKVHVEQFEILLVLEGVVYEYVPNIWESTQKIYELDSLRKQLLLFRKITKKGFYTSYHPKYAHNQSQLVAEAGSILVRIPDRVFSKYFQEKLQQRIGELISVLRSFQFTKLFRVELLYELAKHLSEENYPHGSLIYEKGMASNYFYFIKSGTVELYQKKPSKAQKKRYNLNTILGKGKVVGLDGIITPSNDNKRLFTCQALTSVQLLTIQRRILIILICSAKQRDGIKAYKEVNLTDQFQHKARKSQIIFNRSKLRQSLYINFKAKNKSIVDVFRFEDNLNLNIRRDNPQQYQSRPSVSGSYQSSSAQFLPQSRISVIKMGGDDNHQYQSDTQNTPLKSSMKKKSLSLIKSNSSASRYRREYHRELQQIVEVKKLQEVNAKIKIVSRSKYDEKMKSTSKIKRIYMCSRYQSTPQKCNVEDILFKRLEALNQNPLLLNFESQRKRMLDQVKRSMVK